MDMIESPPDKSNHAVPAAAEDELLFVKLAGKKFPKLYKRLVRIFAPLWCPPSFDRWLAEYFRGMRRVVNLGAGTNAYPFALNLDMELLGTTDVCCNIEQLPFAANSLDGAICLGTLEHVRTPGMVIEELCRTLKPGGRFVFITPFMYGYHAAPNDYMRWTVPGLENLFSRFREIRVVPLAGPTSALLALFQHWFATLVSFNHRGIYRITLILAMLVTCPLKVLDSILCKYQFAATISATYLVTGVKHDPP